MRSGGRSLRRVYPRVCGGTRPGHVRMLTSGGLSPRVRGNLRYQNVNYKCVGSIPACAGEPCRGNLTRRIGPVYPRVCGGTRMGLAPQH